MCVLEGAHRRCRRIKTVGGRCWFGLSPGLPATRGLWYQVARWARLSAWVLEGPSGINHLGTRDWYVLPVPLPHPLTWQLGTRRATRQAGGSMLPRARGSDFYCALVYSPPGYVSPRIPGSRLLAAGSGWAGRVRWIGLGSSGKFFAPLLPRPLMMKIGFPASYKVLWAI